MLKRQPARPDSPTLVVLRTLVKRRRLTAYRLSQSTNLAISTVQNFLDGRGSPTFDTVEAIAAALGLKIDFKQI